jgi:hypothetical protein
MDDMSCSIPAGKTPLLTQDSCISYRHASMRSLAELQSLVDSGELNAVGELTPGLLSEVQEGALTSRQIGRRFGDVVQAHIDSHVQKEPQA